VIQLPKLHIAFITYKFGQQFGGAEHYGVELIRELSKRHDVTVIGYEYDKNCGLNLPFIQINTPKHLPSWLRSLLFAKQVAKITASQPFDIVHSHMNGWNAHVDVLHVRSVRYRWRYQLGLFQRFIHLFSLRNQTYLWLEKKRVHTTPPKTTVVVSKALQQQLQKAYRTKRKFKIIPPGVAQPKLNKNIRHKIRTQLKVAPDEMLCLLVARSPERKGLPTILKALKQLPPCIKLLVVGVQPALLDLFNEQLKPLNLSKRVIYIAQTNQVGPYYQAADIYLHPTLNDSFAMAPLEAMSFKLPVVISSHRYCGFADYTINEKNALHLQNPTDATELKKAILRLKNNSMLREQLISGAEKLVNDFQWATVATQFEQIYAQYIKK